MLTSIFPPDTTHATFFPSTGSLSNMTAVTATAPAPSAITFCFSISASMEAAISSSVTVTISSTYSLTIPKVISPGCFTAIPSAKVAAFSSITGFPATILSCMLADPAACTPYTFIFGLRCLTAYATPDIRPPPPTGTTTASTSSSSSSISSPIVPCPAITSSSLNGCIKVAPVSSCMRRACA